MKGKITLPFLTILFLASASYPAWAQEYWLAPSSDISLDDLCDDIVGNNTEEVSESSRVAHSNNREQFHARDFFNESISNRSSSGGGGLRLPFGFGADGRGGSERSNESRNRVSDHFGQAENESSLTENSRSQSRSTAVVAGRNCSTVVNTMGQAYWCRKLLLVLRKTAVLLTYCQ